MDSSTHSTTVAVGNERGQPRRTARWQTADSGMELPVKNGRCPRGFSALQIAILSVLKAHQQIIAYWQIAELVTARFGVATTTGAVCGALERMYRRTILMRNRAAAGSLKGNLYAFASDPCPYIIVQSVTKVNSQVNTRSTAHSGQISGNSILEEKDRKNTLSISSQEKSRACLEALAEPDIAFHWPQLAASGFGTHQIRQIMERPEQKDLSPDNVLQGLDHAEWVLERGLMKDKDGQAVLHPNNWVFQILAKQGYSASRIYVAPGTGRA